MITRRRRQNRTTLVLVAIVLVARFGKGFLANISVLLGVVIALIWGIGQSFTNAPVKPVGMAGVGNSVGKVRETLVTVVPVVA